MLIQLKNYCDKVGNDFNLFQASGGNISIKTNKFIYIKSSGTTIKNKILTKLSILESRKKILLYIKKNKKFKLSYKKKPSIEVAFHLLLKKKIVFHAHYIDLISWTIDKSKKTKLMKLIKENNFSFIPYVAPGMKLAMKVNLLQDNKSQIFVLENHGVIITADKFKEVDSKINLLKKVFKLKSEYKNLYDLKLINLKSKEYGLKKPKNKIIHNLAFNNNFNFLNNNYLFPDQVVFLKNSYVFENIEKINKIKLTQIVKQNKIQIIIIKNVGVFFSNLNFNKKFVCDLLKCLYFILSKVSDKKKIKKIKKKEISEILNDIHEKYRKNLKV
jgi:rhamnose utilization protein RhaD (predicted bifunctional aldolase and dehydrogenase)